jgi:hypothetical protein
MKKYIVLLIVFILLTSCQTVRSYKPYAVYETVYFSLPNVDSEVTASIGDEIISIGSYETALAVHILKNTESGSVKKGIYFASGIYRYENLTMYRFDGSGIARYVRAGESHDSWIEYNDFDKTLFVTNDTAAGFGREQIFDYLLDENTVMNSDSAYKQSLIFLGKEGAKIKIGYREYKQDLERPSFTNDINYDLSESDIITYKNASLQIITVNNSSIKYKVLSNF